MDVDNIAEVLDLHIHRLTQLYVEEELPLYAISVQRSERLGRLLEDQARRQHGAH